jgi:biopolymer transport protein ExbB
VKLAAASGATQLAPEAVMARISEALVATAIGIFIAIPAVAAFNGFQRVVRGTVANTEALGHLLLAHLKSTPLPAGTGAAAAEGEGGEGGTPQRGGARARGNGNDDSESERN